MLKLSISCRLDDAQAPNRLSGRFSFSVWTKWEADYRRWLILKKMGGEKREKSCFSGSMLEEA